MRLRIARQRAGLTQAELAHRLGVAKSLPGHWETGRKVPSLDKIKAVARALDVSVSWLTEDAIAEDSPDYRPEPAGTAGVLADYNTAPGLRDLASNKLLAEALAITDQEWAMLRSLQAPPNLTADGYLAVLIAVRSHVTGS